MGLVKHFVDFLMRRVLRRKRTQYASWESSEIADNDEVPTTVRTFSPGGDPFDDRIEFHLRKGQGGFRDPR
jgi:hypothetical protein